MRNRELEAQLAAEAAAAQARTTATSLELEWPTLAVKPTLKALGDRGERQVGMEADADAESVSQATSTMTLQSTIHSRERREERGLQDKRALKHVVKHAERYGETRPSMSSLGRPTIVHSLDGLEVTTDQTCKVEVSVWKTAEREQRDRELANERRDRELWESRQHKQSTRLAAAAAAATEQGRGPRILPASESFHTLSDGSRLDLSHNRTGQPLSPEERAAAIADAEAKIIAAQWEAEVVEAEEAEEAQGAEEVMGSEAGAATPEAADAESAASRMDTLPAAADSGQQLGTEAAPTPQPSDLQLQLKMAELRKKHSSARTRSSHTKRSSNAAGSAASKATSGAASRSATLLPSAGLPLGFTLAVAWKPSESELAQRLDASRRRWEHRSAQFKSRGSNGPDLDMQALFADQTPPPRGGPRKVLPWLASPLPDLTTFETELRRTWSTGGVKAVDVACAVRRAVVEDRTDIVELLLSPAIGLQPIDPNAAEPTFAPPLSAAPSLRRTCQRSSAVTRSHLLSSVQAVSCSLTWPLSNCCFRVHQAPCAYSTRSTAALGASSTSSRPASPSRPSRRLRSASLKWAISSRSSHPRMEPPWASPRCGA